MNVCLLVFLRNHMVNYPINSSGLCHRPRPIDLVSSWMILHFLLAQGAWLLLCSFVTRTSVWKTQVYINLTLCLKGGWIKSSYPLKHRVIYWWWIKSSYKICFFCAGFVQYVYTFTWKLETWAWLLLWLAPAPLTHQHQH